MVKVRVLGTHSVSSTANIVSVDRIAIVPSTATPPPMLVGDVNGDGHVTSADLAVLLSHWNTQSGAVWATGDLNSDGKVTTIDLALLLSNWGK